MMGLARPGLGRVPDIGFWKLCGSGTGEGFTPVPNTTVYAILGDLARPRARRNPASRKARPSIAFAAERKRSWTVYLGPVSARGAWSGVQPFQQHQTLSARPCRRPDPRDDPPCRRAALLAASARHQRGDRRGPERDLQDRHRRGAAAAPGHLLDLARRRVHGRASPAPMAPTPVPSSAVREGRLVLAKNSMRGSACWRTPAPGRARDRSAQWRRQHDPRLPFLGHRRTGAR